MKKSPPVKPLVSVDGVNTLDVQGTEILNELKSRLTGLCSTKLLRAGNPVLMCVCVVNLGISSKHWRQNKVLFFHF